MYSSIKRKMCKKCFVNYPKIGLNGFCSLKCMPEEMAAMDKYKKKPLSNFRRNKLNNLSAKVKSLPEVQNGKGEAEKAVRLKKWFDNRMTDCFPKCDNCGKSSMGLKNKPVLWKSCQAHLLPKRHFESLLDHPLNGMVLGSGFSGLCFCHDDYDNSWHKASTMPIWEEVVRRFKIMYPLIPAHEHRFIPDQLLQEINQI